MCPNFEKWKWKCVARGKEFESRLSSLSCRCFSRHRICIYRLGMNRVCAMPGETKREMRNVRNAGTMPPSINVISETLRYKRLFRLGVSRDKFAFYGSRF